jgi:SHAQKYF class myb-like DNA-binding protein
MPRLTPVTRRPRKPYRLLKPREAWSAEEHERFVEALELYERDWKRIEQYIGTKSVVQIRSHAQKYFLKLQKSNQGSRIPPARKRRTRGTLGGAVDAVDGSDVGTVSSSGSGAAPQSAAPGAAVGGKSAGAGPVAAGPTGAGWCPVASSAASSGPPDGVAAEGAEQVGALATESAVCLGPAAGASVGRVYSSQGNGRDRAQGSLRARMGLPDYSSRAPLSVDGAGVARARSTKDVVAWSGLVAETPEPRSGVRDWSRDLMLDAEHALCALSSAPAVACPSASQGRPSRFPSDVEQTVGSGPDFGSIYSFLARVLECPGDIVGQRLASGCGGTPFRDAEDRQTPAGCGPDLVAFSRGSESGTVPWKELYIELKPLERDIVHTLMRHLCRNLMEGERVRNALCDFREALSAGSTDRGAR